VFFDQTKATVIAHSKSAVTGKEIITFELEFPRPILAEFNTHNALSKNASSSRAIPVPTMLKQVRETPAYLARYGAANTGMQDNGAHNDLIYFNESDEDGNQIVLGPHEAWAHIANKYAEYAQLFHSAGYAKQVCNRLIEPFQMMKVVMTATELNNFKWLRRHDAADPTIDSLCQKVIAAQEASVPVVLQSGEWHVPYYNEGYWIPSSTARTTDGPVVVDKFGHSLEHALIISSSCSAQVSYRKLDDTIEKARGVVARLNLQGEEPDQPVHASPLEHQATPIAEYKYQHGFAQDFEVNAPGFPHTWEEGITHMDRDGTLCSGNLKGFIQHRQLVPNHVKKG
jgi:hypothetical protein